MKSYNGDIWAFAQNKDAYIVITTNGVVKKNGEAVMGAGLARQARDKYPGIAYGLGQALVKNGNVVHVNTKLRMIAVPTKHHWKDEHADIKLIEESVQTLVKIIDKLQIKQIFLPQLGCGNGKLSWTYQIMPLISPMLDDRFTVCIKKQSFHPYGFSAP